MPESVFPGSTKGKTIITGHGTAHNGVFKELKTLEIGDTISLEKGNGDVVKYQVLGLSNKQKSELNIDMFGDLNAEQHTLILISLENSTKVRTSDSVALVVYAEQVN
jgi:LPXTG-site transpeptidase (sortase) family protein